MDLLYSKYSNPLEFMNLYINQGRFGEFVENIIDLENKKRDEASEKENEDKMFNMYIHSMSDKSYNQWKDDVLNGQPQNQDSSQQIGSSLSMTDEQVEDQLNKSRNIIKGFSMK